MDPSSPSSNECGPWVVWCFEHCLYREYDRLRKELTDSAMMSRCRFICHKKAMGFLSWLDEAQQARVLLIADWREAKPIMEELGKKEPRHDILLCVAARSDRMFRRAVAWASKQSADTDIIVSSSFSCQNLEDLIERHLETSVTSWSWKDGKIGRWTEPG